MDIRETIATLLIISSVVYGYFYITKKIDAKQSGITVKGTIVEKHLESDYTYIRFKYPVNGKDVFKSVRLTEPNRYEEGGPITLTYLPADPTNPFIDFKKEEVDKELNHLLTIMMVYLTYRFIRSMIYTVRPNWD